MNKAKLVNSVLTGGGIGSPQHLNVVIGNEDKGFPRGHVLDANATLALAGTGGGTPNDSFYEDLKKRISTSYDSASVSEVFNIKPKPGSNYTSINISNYKDDINKFSYTNSFGGIQSGFLNRYTGYDSVLLGSGIFTDSIADTITGSNCIVLNVEKIPNNNKLCLRISKNSFAFKALKAGLLMITDQFAVARDNDGTIKYTEVGVGYQTIRDTSDYTILSDNVIQFNNPYLNKLKDCDNVFAYSIYTKNSKNSILFGRYIASNSENSIAVGTGLSDNLVHGGKSLNCVSLFGSLNSVKNNGEFACGFGNVSNLVENGNVRYCTLFSIGSYINMQNSNALEVLIKREGQTVTDNNMYVYGIGNYDGTNATSTQSKSLQQVISDIETAVQLNSNGPWDIDITSEFVNGNVTIKPLSMWSINQGVKRVYFTANLKQGDVITIPNTLRMYIGWKKAENRFGMADWATAGKNYTVTEDSYYVILIATENDNPGVQTNTLPSYGRVMLRTSNPEFKPTAKTDAKKDHTNDDKVMRSIAHQGFHKTERPNSLAAFRAAAKEGWRYVETDTYMTKDGKFIVSHDDNVPVGYTNGTVTLTDKTYKYGDHTLADILAFHGPNGEKVDTLEEFCKTCKECGLHPYIEIKQGMMWEANTIDTTNVRYNGKPYAIKLLDIVNRYGLRGNATFISSTPYTLRLMAQQDQSYRYGIVYFGQIGVTIQDWTTVLSKIEEFNNDANASKAYLFIDVNIDNLKTADANFANWLVLRNCALEVWTAKTKKDLNNLDPYITGVTCDNIHAGEILAKDI